jgi:hypothetical protein
MASPLPPRILGQHRPIPQPKPALAWLTPVRAPARRRADTHPVTLVRGPSISNHARFDPLSALKRHNSADLEKIGRIGLPCHTVMMS